MKKVLDIASKYLGVREIPGHEDNPQIVRFFADVGHDWVKDDETAWCAAFMGSVLKEAGYPHTGKLNARSYLMWGDPVQPEDAQPGDVMIFSRGSPDGWQGHVAPLVRVVKGGYIVRGGNQSNAVSDAFYPEHRLLGVRRMTLPEEPLQPTRSFETLLRKAVEAISGFLNRRNKT